jgi:hypothetical protein
MPITISGSTGIAGVDGSAATPAVQGTDTNTGIVFPAADTVTVATGGSERMRVDSSGNVGIGTSSPGGKLGVSDGTVQIITGPFGAGLTGYFGTSTNHVLAFITNNTERARIDSSGNVGIGTTSPSSNLDVVGWATVTTSVTAGAGLRVRTPSGSGSAAVIQFTDNPVTAQWGYIFSPALNVLGFGGNSEYARFNSSGVFLVGTTTGLSGHTLQNSAGATTYRPTTTSGFGIHHFYSDVSGTSTLKAYVQADGTYLNASDEKLKTNIVKARSYLNDLMRIEIVNYTWKGGEDNERRLGVIAQQVESVFPSLVKEVIGNPTTGETQKMLPQEVFIPMLITAIQELKTENDALKERIAALEVK